MTECPFCTRIERMDYIILDSTLGIVRFKPLNPVASGHMLFVPVRHVTDASMDPDLTGQVMARAAEWANQAIYDTNLITSIGPLATQTVQHLHVHYVPRRAHDGLPLPWTPQQEEVTPDG